MLIFMIMFKSHFALAKLDQSKLLHVVGSNLLNNVCMLCSFFMDPDSAILPNTVKLSRVASFYGSVRQNVLLSCLLTRLYHAVD